MRSNSYQTLNVPVRLHLEYEQITVGELSNILRQWQALLRCAWEESFQSMYSEKPPYIRIFTLTSTSGNSIEFISDYAILATFINFAFGPVTDWPRQARIAFNYIWQLRQRQLTESARSPEGLTITRPRSSEEVENIRGISIVGGPIPRLNIPLGALENDKTGERIERLWRIANNSAIDISMEQIEESDDQTQ